MGIITIEYILGAIVATLVMVQLLHLFIIYSAPHRSHKTERKGLLKASEKQPGLSVIITASDQEEMLTKNLPLILNQDYPDFEVIVVDDNSKDETKELLERLAQQYPNLYATYTSDSIRYVSHKKLALTLGIKAAKKEWVVFIEPDCYPVSYQWLARMARHCDESVDVVLGYSNYERKPGFANLCYMYDTMMQQLHLLGLTLLRGGYKGVGRNMAYRRELFFAHKGYSRHLDLERGEDDLFVYEHVLARRITADISADSVVRSRSGFSSWQNDKLSRLFIRTKMRGLRASLFSFDTWTRVLLYMAIVSNIVVSVINHWWILIGATTLLWLIYLSCRILVLHRTACELNERRYNVSIPLFDILHPLWELFYYLRMRLSSKEMHLRRKL